MEKDYDASVGSDTQLFIKRVEVLMSSTDTQTVKVTVEVSAADWELLQGAAALKWSGVAMENGTILLELAKMAGNCLQKRK